MLVAALPAAGGPVIPNYGGGSSCAVKNGTFCWDWFTQNWSRDFQPKLIQHIELTVIAVAIGFAISFLLALLAHRAHWVAAPVTVVTSILYIIPAIAAFEILVPITGLGWTTVLIPLTGYTLLILFTNTLAGLSGVPAEVRDAAKGIGLTDRQTLYRVELPLALPTIIAGIRVATVTTVSLATLAAIATPLGLGQPIFYAFSIGNFNTLFVGAGVLAILLAIVADTLLVGAQHFLTPWARARRAG